MAHPRDNEIYPVGSVVRILKTGEMAIITSHTFKFMGSEFLHYEAEIEGRKGKWCLIHDRIELEALPPENKQAGSSTE